MREAIVLDYDLAGGDLYQCISGDHRIDLRIRAAGVRVEHRGKLRGSDIDREPVGRCAHGCAAVQIELQRVEHADRDTFGRRAVGGDDRRNLGGEKLIVSAVGVDAGRLAVERLPAAGGQATERAGDYENARRLAPALEK